MNLVWKKEMNSAFTVPSKSITDKEVITRVLNGEKNLYEALMRKYNQRLYRIGMSIINNSEEVEDLMQATYIKAYEHLADYQFRSEFSTWLIRILINESLQQKVRAQKTQGLNGFDYTEEPNAESPLQKVMNNELRIILEKALNQLPEKYRLVFVMREVESMSTMETMECLNISESNVKVRLNRAKEMLRSSISEFYKVEELYDFHLTRCDNVVKNVLLHIHRS